MNITPGIYFVSEHAVIRACASECEVRETCCKTLYVCRSDYLFCFMYRNFNYLTDTLSVVVLFLFVFARF